MGTFYGINDFGYVEYALQNSTHQHIAKLFTYNIYIYIYIYIRFIYLIPRKFVCDPWVSLIFYKTTIIRQIAKWNESKIENTEKKTLGLCKKLYVCLRERARERERERERESVCVCVCLCVCVSVSVYIYVCVGFSCVLLCVCVSGI